MVNYVFLLEIEKKAVELYKKAKYDSASYLYVETAKIYKQLAEKSQNRTVLGFKSRKQKFYPFLFEGSSTAEVVIACFDQFCETLLRKTVVVLDNAPTYRSNLFLSKIEHWKQKGLHIYFIPPYSPELNLIERLWKEIKYSRMPVTAFKNINPMTKQITYILKNVGNGKFPISFV